MKTKKFMKAYNAAMDAVVTTHLMGMQNALLSIISAAGGDDNARYKQRRYENHKGSRAIHRNNPAEEAATLGIKITEAMKSSGYEVPGMIIELRNLTVKALMGMVQHIDKKDLNVEIAGCNLEYLRDAWDEAVFITDVIPVMDEIEEMMDERKFKKAKSALITLTYRIATEGAAISMEYERQDPNGLNEPEKKSRGRLRQRFAELRSQVHAGSLDQDGFYEAMEALAMEFPSKYWDEATEFIKEIDAVYANMLEMAYPMSERQDQEDDDEVHIEHYDDDDDDSSDEEPSGDEDVSDGEDEEQEDQPEGASEDAPAEEQPSSPIPTPEDLINTTLPIPEKDDDSEAQKPRRRRSSSKKDSKDKEK